MCIFYVHVCFIRIELSEKIARKCSSKMVNNFKMYCENIVCKKIEPRIFCKNTIF